MTEWTRREAMGLFGAATVGAAAGGALPAKVTAAGQGARAGALRQSEFIPTRDPMTSLRAAIVLCDV